jgi:hypothetical protein
MSDDAPFATLPRTRAPDQRRVPAEMLAFVLTLVWFAMLWLAFRLLGGAGADVADVLGLVVVALAVFLPVALIWLAVLVLRSARQMRDESIRLHATVEAMRRNWIREQQAAGLSLKPTVEQRLDDIVEAQRKTESTLAMFTTRRSPAPVLSPTAPLPGAGITPAAHPDQPGLALDAQPATAVPLDMDVMLRALNFPENAEDAEGFAALRLALADHPTGELIRAAQDVLTVLSQEGIYMDDLRPDRARPELWRAFARGQRGQVIAGLGGVRDRSCLALTTGRMRADPRFRDAAHRFLRAFDRRLADAEPGLSDGELARLAETRSARAFMLLGRVTGMFG